MTTLFLALESRDIHTTILLVHVYAVHVHGYGIYHVHNSMYDRVSLHLWCVSLCVYVRACVRACVCVFRMFFEKPVLLTVDHWYTAVACVSSPSGASSDAGSSGQREITGPERCSTFTARVNTCMFMYMYMYYTFVPACLYTQSILDLYMYMYI